MYIQGVRNKKNNKKNGQIADPKVKPYIGYDLAKIALLF
jgi:hypothetical protein